MSLISRPKTSLRAIRALSLQNSFHKAKFMIFLSYFHKNFSVFQRNLMNYSLRSALVTSGNLHAILGASPNLKFLGERFYAVWGDCMALEALIATPECPKLFALSYQWNFIHLPWYRSSANNPSFETIMNLWPLRPLVTQLGGLLFGLLGLCLKVKR